MKKLYFLLMGMLGWLSGAFAQAPTNLSLRVVSPAQICVSWTDNTTSELGFEVERSTDRVNFTKVADVAANTVEYCNINLSPSTLYYYRVRAKLTATLFSSYSNTDFATTQAAPGAPTGLTVSVLSSSSLRLQWGPNTFAYQYDIERRTGQSGAFAVVATVSFARLVNRQYDNTGLNDGTEYCYRVRIRENDGTTSPYSIIACGTTPLTAPAAPARLTATAVSSSQINLSWADLSDNETGFEVERSTDTRNYTKIADVGANVTTYQNTGLSDNTPYCYRVRAKNTAGNSAYTDPACATTPLAPPAAPARLTATAVSSSQINLSWADLSDNETGFEIELSTDTRNYTKIADVAANVTTYQNTGLNDNTQYCYRVRAKNTAGNSAYTDPACATTPLAPPAAPARLTATAVSSSQINLSWADLSDNETGFEIERSTDGTNFTKIADVAANATSYQSIGLNASTRYWYRVRAKNAAGNSSFSNIADATTQAPPVTIPRPPSALTATAVSSSQIDLVWTDNATNETGFEIERSTDGTNFTKIADVAANATSYQSVGLNASTRYWYRVRAKNSAGNSSFSNIADATTQAPPVTIPRPPSALTASAVSSSQIDLAWTDNATDETGFEVERSTDGTNFTKIADVAANATSYQSISLNASTRYWYRVRARNAAGNSSYSNIADATTQAPPITIPRPPSALTASAVSSSQIDLAWTDNATDETGFEIERSTDGTNFTKIADVAANATSYQSIGLNASTRYWYRVRAKNAAGNSSFSNIADATTQAPPVTIPRPPSALTATAVSSSQIDLAWTDNATDETGFEVERSTDGTNFTKIADVAANATSYQSISLNASTRYWYRVRARNAAGNSAYSNIADATTQAPPVTIPRPPSALTASAVSSSQIDLVWTDNATDETGFEIERSTDGTNFTKIADVAANATSYQSIGLNASTRYWYRVRAKNTAGNSSYTNIADATTQAPSAGGTLEAPRNLIATPIDFDLVRLSWIPVDRAATSIVIERSTSPTSGFVQIGQVPADAITFADRDVLAVANHYYRIKSINAVNSSPYSNVATLLANLIINSATQNRPASIMVSNAGKLLNVKLDGTPASDLQIRIVNLLGQVRFEAILERANEWLIDLSAVESGFYVVQAETHHLAKAQKIILN